MLHSTYLGGGASDKALALATDSVGNAYVAGLTQSIDFPLSNASQPASGGGTDAFVSKIDADGSALLWSTYIGGSGIDAASAIAHDSAGNTYIAGYTSSPDFPTTPNAYQSAFHGGGRDAFVVKLDPNGALVYATYLGGSGVDAASAIAVDGAGHAFVAGYTCSADFPVANAFQPSLHGPPNGCFAAEDAFVARLSANGTMLDYSTYYGGSGADEANGIAVDSLDRAYLTGDTRSSDLPVAGNPVSSYRGGDDAFVAAFASGGDLVYATWLGGSNDDAGSAIALDAEGGAYVAGSTRSDDFPLQNPLQSQFGGGEDGFVLKLMISATAATASLAYSSFLGGKSDDGCRAIAIDRDGSAYVTGYTTSSFFPVTGAVQWNLGGAEDAFVTRIDPDGALGESTFFGGDDLDDGWAIALGSTWQRGTTIVHVAGWTLSDDLAKPGAMQAIPPGSFDGFVARIGPRP
ncbi:MAG TPA: SBBP repeat-containing protein [Rhodanobacteraceae bacterium]|nr:SBBP repeat-containing protein [Rhodanobacteraceae bacterium]